MFIPFCFVAIRCDRHRQIGERPPKGIRAAYGISQSASRGNPRHMATSLLERSSWQATLWEKGYC